MPHPYGTRPPQAPVHQKHADPKHSDGAAFLAGLVGNEAADVNLQWFFNRLHDHTQIAGGRAFGMHWRAPGPNGYERITVGITGHLLTRRLTARELHSENWTAPQVRRWRRGRTRFGPHPMTWDDICRYCAKHGGQPVGELKSPAFAAYAWTMDQLVATCKRHNVAAWFKALATMSGPAAKCANTVRAGGFFMLIFGDHVKGRDARLAAGRKITANWPVKPTHIW